MQALRVISEQLALAEGRATSNVNVNADLSPNRPLDVQDEEADRLQEIVDILLNLHDYTLSLIHDGKRELPDVG